MFAHTAVSFIDQPAWIRVGHIELLALVLRSVAALIEGRHHLGLLDDLGILELALGP